MKKSLMFCRITELAEPEDRMLAVLEWYLTSFHAGRQVSNKHTNTKNMSLVL